MTTRSRSLSIFATNVSANGVLTSGGTLSTQSVQTANFTAASNRLYPIDTTNGAVTVTLPANPSAGDTIQFIDYAGTWATNNVSVNTNGKKFNGLIGYFLLSTNRESDIFTYVDSVKGWLSSGISIDNKQIPTAVEYIIVAGGGGGSGAWAFANYAGGGGGAGGLLNGTINLTSGTTYQFVIGAGGSGGGQNSNGGNGNDSTAFGLTSIGGGGGTVSGGGTRSGGSGGGASNVANGGAGTTGQGYAGGGSVYVTGGGGGGGAGGLGGYGNVQPSPRVAGSGGIGFVTNINGNSCQFNGYISGTTLTVTSVAYGTIKRGSVINGVGLTANTIVYYPISASGSTGTYQVNNSQSIASSGSPIIITTTSLYYAGGGGGGVWYTTGGGEGGLGGGGAGGYSVLGGINSYPGDTNTGGGGGAGSTINSSESYGSSGGSGVVILAIPTGSYTGTTSGSPTVSTTTRPGYTILTFTSSGSYTA